jgi:hypothetical protein
VTSRWLWREIRVLNLSPEAAGFGFRTGTGLGQQREGGGPLTEANRPTSQRGRSPRKNTTDGVVVNRTFSRRRSSSDSGAADRAEEGLRDPFRTTSAKERPEVTKVAGDVRFSLESRAACLEASVRCAAELLLPSASLS